MASIRVRQRKDGTTYTSVLYVHQSKQTSSSFNDHSEALKFQDVVDRLGPAEALRIWKAAKPSEGHTVASFIAQHIEALSGVEKKTLAEYQRYLTRDIKPVLGHIPLSTLARSDIARWVNAMHDVGTSGKTVQNKVGFLSGCLNVAVREGLMAANPAVGVRLPRTVQRQMTFLTPGEFALLRTSFTPRWWPFLDFLVASGCRFSEATALMPGDIDRANNTVRVSRAWKRVPGIDADGGYELGQPKTRRSIRTINVPASVLNQLENSNEFVFVNSDGGPIRIYSWRTNVWVPSLGKARAKDPKNPEKVVLEKPVRIHDLRHSCASWLLGAGVPLITVSAHLGHQDTSVTAKIYGHLDRTSGQAEAAAMDELLTI
jgi:integrase